MTDPAAELRAALHAINGEIPVELAENDGWPQQAMPAMLKALGLTEAPEIGWFVDATSPMYDAAKPDGWRYCFVPASPDKSALLGIAFAGPPPRIYLRADVDLTRCIQTLGHELYHVREFARGDPTDEAAADEFGAQAAARFWGLQYR